MRMKLISQLVGSGIILLFLCVGCNNDCSRNPALMLGRWKSLEGKPDLTIGKDSTEYHAVVYHTANDGKECALRYPLVYQDNSTYIKAQSRIILIYSKKNKTLFLSPGGEYCRSQTNDSI